MVVDLPAPFGPIRPTSSPRSMPKLTAVQRLDLAPAAVEQAADGPHRPRVALGDAIGLRQLLDEDLGHGWAPALDEGARNLVKRSRGVNDRCYAIERGA